MPDGLFVDLPDDSLRPHRHWATRATTPSPLIPAKGGGRPVHHFYAARGWRGPATALTPSGTSLGVLRTTTARCSSSRSRPVVPGWLPHLRPAQRRYLVTETNRSAAPINSTRARTLRPSGG